MATVADKRALLEAIGALAVDMESHAVAAVATAAGIPFLVIRAIADPADRVVPQAALEALRPDGGSASVATFGGVIRQPGQLIASCAWAATAPRRQATLRRAARLAGPALEFG